jgi:superfamily II DNA/RNA helicase
LKKVLEEAGITCSTIDGSMTLEARKQSLVDFKEHCRVMVATDAAGESLNMQFCHIAVNYDLPWNPMAIEQRIGRVDRIGQKSGVVAINMITDNSVDTRVYEIITEKLDLILRELGIDKTSDVLDSAIDNKKITHLHLQSLLDPQLFKHQSEQWLYEIKKKLKEKAFSTAIFSSATAAEECLSEWGDAFSSLFADTEVISIGPGTAKALGRMGIETYPGNSGDSDKVVEAFLAGDLASSTDPTCGHHDGGHSCQGGCHH